jgi:hypothetical protein
VCQHDAVHQDQQTATTRTLLLRVLGRISPCPTCQHQMLWVVGLVPVHRPTVGEFVTTDLEGAIAIAATILHTADQAAIAARLRPRPAGARGASFNPNTCAGCGTQPGWYALNRVIDAAVDYGPTDLARGRCPVTDWRRAVNTDRYVICWLPT